MQQWTKILIRLPKALLFSGLILLVLLILGPLAYRYGLVGLGPVFQLFQVIAIVAVVLAIVSLIITVALRYKKLAGVGLSRLALVFLLMPVGVLGVQLYNARSVPPIHDISTDWQDPPTFSAVLEMRSETHNSLEPNPEHIAIQHDFYGNLGGPLVLPLSPMQVMQMAESAARDMGWDLLSYEPEAGRLEAVDTTLWFGFRDDIVVRAKSVGAGATVLDIRSASRVGISDLGKNAERIREFLECIKQLEAEPAS